MTAHFSIWSQFYNTKEPEEAILEFEKDGLEYIELSSEHIESLLERKGNLTEIGRDFANFCLLHGVKIPQAHMVFPSNYVTSPEVADSLIRQMELLDGMGVARGVLHGDPMTGFDIPYVEKLNRNAEALKGILERGRHTKITLCLENLRQIFPCIEDILYVIERVGSDRLAVCLDTGHLNRTRKNTQREFILRAAGRLKALHIADNDGEVDQHLIPFGRGNVDFFEVAEALREINYEGVFNYEIGGDSGKCPVPVKHYKYVGIKATYDYIMGNLK